MSHSYDVMSSVFNSEIAPKLDYELAYRFENLINQMHEANHRLNDGINKDSQVSDAARKLDAYAQRLRDARRNQEENRE